MSSHDLESQKPSPALTLLTTGSIDTINLLLLASLLLGMLLQQYVFHSLVFTVIYPVACLYIGASASLNNYCIVPEKTEKEQKSAAESGAPQPTLANQVWQAVRVPVFSTFALLTLYFSVKQEFH